MKRYPHYWYPLSGKTCPPRIAVLDCSVADHTTGMRSQPRTDGVRSWHLAIAEMRNGVRVGGILYSGGSADGALDRLAALCLHKGTTWVFIDHAFDTLAAIGYWDALAEGHIRLAGEDWTVERGDGKSGEDAADGLCCIEDPPTLILCGFVDNPGKLLILDTRNHGIDTNDLPPGASERSAVLLGGICAIVQTLRQGVPVSLRGTAASQAVQVLRTRHDVRRLHCHTHPQCLQLERSAYFGGRVEAYRTGVIPGPVYHVDVRSMYPSIGLTLAVPVSLRGYYGDSSSARRAVESGGADCCAHVRVRCDQPRFPRRAGGETEYPVGDFDTWLSGPELLKAVRGGMVRTVYAAARYNCYPALAGFYDWGLQLLQDARGRQAPILVQFTKRIMNGLVGKFGEPGRRWVGCPSRTEKGPFDEWPERGNDGEWTRYRNIGWHTQRLERHGESYWSIPAIAGWIASAGRVRLWHYLETAGRGNVWYTDTDGLLTNALGYDRLLRGGHIREGEVGYLRLLGCYSQATIFGIRHYKLGNTIKCAGVRNGAIQEGETREDYFRRTGDAAATPLARIRRMRDED